MKTKKTIGSILMVIMITIAMSIVGDSFAESGSSMDFQLDYGGIVEEGEVSTSNDFILDAEIVDIGTVSESADYQVEPVVYNRSAVCGNGVKETGEECDGLNFGGATCATYGFTNGLLVCNLCVINTGSCYNIPPPAGGGGGVVYQPPQEEEEEIQDQEEVGEETVEEPVPVVSPEEPPQEPQEEQKPEEEESQAAREPAGEEPAVQSPTPQVIPAEPQEVPEEPLETFHIQPDIVGDHTPEKTSDKTPVISGEMDPDTEYKVQILGPLGEIIEGDTVVTDDEGKFVYEPDRELDQGVNIIYFLDHESGDVKLKYSIEVIEDGQGEFEISRFFDRGEVPVDFENEIFLGAILGGTGQVISGHTEPDAYVYAYFESKVRIVSTRADQDGNFEIKVPDDLECGDRKVRIVKVSADGVISNDLTYKFKYFCPLDKQSYQEGKLDYDAIPWKDIFIILTIFVIIYEIHNYLSDENKK